MRRTSLVRTVQYTKLKIENVKGAGRDFSVVRGRALLGEGTRFRRRSSVFRSRFCLGAVVAWSLSLGCSSGSGPDDGPQDSALSPREAT